MRWLAIAAVVIVIAAIAFFPFEKVYDDGEWPLSVTVRSAANRPIKGVSAEAVVGVERARQRQDSLPPIAVTRLENSRYAAVQEPYLGRPVEVKVPTSETSFRSLLWTHPRFFQYRGLLVVVEYEDGKVEGRAVDIPDLRQSRLVTVEVP